MAEALRPYRKLFWIEPPGTLDGGAVVYPTAYPGTRRRLEAYSIEVRLIDISELAKAEGGVTCCSLIFNA